MNLQSDNSIKPDQAQIPVRQHTDDLKRLTGETVSSTLSTTYANNGNITNHSDIGDYTYGDYGPQAVTELDNTGASTMVPQFDQSIDYTAFNKASHISQGNLDYFITYGADRLRRKTRLNSGIGDDVLLTKYYVFGDYEKATDADGTRHLHYISGGDGLAAIYVKYDYAPDSMYFIMKDHIGSTVGAINEETGTVFRQSFDAWGRNRNPENWTYADIPDFIFDRGYTGHEHLKWFGLINMLSEAKSRSEAVAGNGRMYDAALCRFLSPDPHVQMPDYSQNFNRYSYALNNPLVYTDPSGEFIFGYTFGFFRGLFSGKNPFQEGWETGVNELKIYGGLFATDPNKEPHERAWEFVSRFTWQLPQTIGGFASAYWTNNFTDVNWVKYKYGTTVLQTNGEWGGITQGNYIIGDKSIETDVGNRLFQHEYGHYIQSQKSGWFYYSKYGIPSALSKKPHNQNLVEQDANVRAFLYFSEHVDGFNWVDKWGNQRSKWVSWYNPINRYDWSRPITDHANQLALKNGTLKLSWHDYSLGPNILLSGLLNALILNHEY